MLISVIIPACNEEAKIGAAIWSVRNQDYDQGNVEIIIVVDSSTDKTLEIASFYKANLIAEVNYRNACKARNIGAAIANGIGLLFMDADCQLLSQNLLKDIEMTIRENWPTPVFSSFLTVPDSSDLRAKILIRTQNIVKRFGICAGPAFFIPRWYFHFIGGFNENQMTGEWHDLVRRAKRGWRPKRTVIRDKGQVLVLETREIPDMLIQDTKRLQGLGFKNIN